MPHPAYLEPWEGRAQDGRPCTLDNTGVDHLLEALRRCHGEGRPDLWWCTFPTAPTAPTAEKPERHPSKEPEASGLHTRATTGGDL